MHDQGYFSGSSGSPCHHLARPANARPAYRMERGERTTANRSSMEAAENLQGQMDAMQAKSITDGRVRRKEAQAIAGLTPFPPRPLETKQCRMHTCNNIYVDYILKCLHAYMQVRVGWLGQAVSQRAVVRDVTLGGAAGNN